MSGQTLVAPPKEVRLKSKLNELELSWPDGLTSRLSCLILRKSGACTHGPFFAN
jgi:DUF971 family protein